MSKPRWFDDDWEVVSPDPEKVICKDCFFREPDATLFSGTVIHGCTKMMCGVFPSKPTDILFKNDHCPYYVSEKEVDE